MEYYFFNSLDGETKAVFILGIMGFFGFMLIVFIIKGINKD